MSKKIIIAVTVVVSLVAFICLAMVNNNSKVTKQTFLTEEEISKVIDNYSKLNDDSILKEEGVKKALFKAQNAYHVDPMALFAISCYETAFGTSRMATEGKSYFGFMPAADMNDSSLEDKYYYECSKICEEYFLNGQESFYELCNNNGVHEYSTSDSWVTNVVLIKSELDALEGQLL